MRDRERTLTIKVGYKVVVDVDSVRSHVEYRSL